MTFKNIPSNGVGKFVIGIKGEDITDELMLIKIEDEADILVQKDKAKIFKYEDVIYAYVHEDWIIAVKDPE